VILMIRSMKSIFLGIVMILVISFILPGCYTQLSRPHVDTDDEYYQEYYDDEVDEYYQDEGTPPAEDIHDVYIDTYYPSYWTDYNDYWYYSHYPWRYVGPYPYHWWDPYGHWWAPGWYAGFSYYDSWWGGYPHYYNNYNRYGYSKNYSKRTFDKRPFARRSMRGFDRDRRTDAEGSLSKPIGPARVERPGTPSTTLATPIRDNSVSPDRNQRSVKEMINNRLKSKNRVSKKIMDDKRPTILTKKRPIVRKPATKTIKNQPRTSKSYTKPRIINKATSKSRPAASKKKYSAPRKSNKSYSTGSRSSSTTRVSKPSSSSGSRSSGVRSSPTRSSTSRSSGSKSSGSSKSSGKSGKK